MRIDIERFTPAFGWRFVSFQQFLHRCPPSSRVG
jgi:hypothetical protein